MLGTTCLPFKLCWKGPQITSSLPFLSCAPRSLYAIFWSLLELILSPELECKLPKEHFSDLHLWNIYLNFLYTFTFMSNTVFSIWEVPNNTCWLFAIKECLRILLKAIFLFNLFRPKKNKEMFSAHLRSDRESSGGVINVASWLGENHSSSWTVSPNLGLSDILWASSQFSSTP